MKLRILQYLMCLLLLSPFLLVDNMGEKIHFLRWIAFPIIVGLLGFLIYKTRKAKLVKKLVLAFALTLSIGTVINVSLPTPIYAAEKTPQEKLAELKVKQKEIEDKIIKAHARGEKTSGFLGLGGLDKELKDVMADIKKLQQEMMENCTPAADLLRENCADCWPCKLMDLIIKAVDKVAVGFFRILEQGKYPLKILGWGFAFWILFHVLKMLMTFSDAKFFATFFKQTIACVVAATFLALPISEIMDWFVTPLFQFGEGLSDALTKAATDADPGAGGTTIDGALFSELGVSRDECKYTIEGSAGKTAFSPELRESILNMVSNLYQTATPPIVIGQTLVCYSRSKGATEIPFINISIPDFGMLFIGCLIVCSYTLMMVLIPFYFADAFVKVGFIVILMPFYIVAAAFEKTRHIMTAGLNSLLSAIAVFTTSCMMMVFIVQLFYAAIVDNPSKIAKQLAGGDDAVPGLYNLLGGNGSGGMTFLMIVGVSYLSFKMIKMIDPLASALMGKEYQSTSGDTPQWAAGQAMSGFKFAGAVALAGHAGVSKLASVAGNRMMNAGKIRHEKATAAKMMAAGHRNYSETLSNKAQKNAASAKDHAQKAASSTGLGKAYHQTAAAISGVLGKVNAFKSNWESKKADKVLKKNKKVIAKDNAKRAEIQGKLATGKEDLRNKAVGHEKKADAYERLAEKKQKALGDLKWYDPRNLSPARILAKGKINKLAKKAEKESKKGASLRLDEKNLEYKLMTETPRGLKIAGGVLKGLGDSGLAANKLISKLTGIDEEMKSRYWDNYMIQRDKWLSQKKEEKAKKEKLKKMRKMRMAEIDVHQKQAWQEERKNLMSQQVKTKEDFNRITNNLVNRDAKNAIKVDHRLGRRIQRGLDGMFGGSKKA